MKYRITDAARIEASLTGRAGKPDRGRALYADADRTGCMDCHGDPSDSGVPEDGPALADVAERLDPGEMRLWLVAPEVREPTTRMPAYYAANQRRDADDDNFGGPRLTAKEIEDLVAYLVTLRGR